MMRNYKYTNLNCKSKAHTLLFILLTIVSLSCKKYLEAKPDDKLTVPENLQDLQALLDNAIVMNNKTACYDEASADNYFLTPANYLAIGLKGQAAYSWQPYPNNYTNDYASAYLVIYNSNVCLNALDKIERNQVTALSFDNVRGSALFFRASQFLKLLWIYAKAYDQSSENDPGIILRLGTDFNEVSKRSSIKDCYDRVIQDLTTSIDLLPNIPQHVLRPSKAAAYAMLARTYLSMRIYDKAYEFSDKCLKIKSTLTDYNKISPSATSPFQSYNEEVIFHSDISTTYYFNISPTYSSIDTTLYRSYASDDLRKTLYFAAVGNYQQFKGSYASRGIGTRPLFTGIATDEVYLMRAEALARIGDRTGAMRDLNTLLKTRWKNSIPYKELMADTDLQALNLVLTERRKELIYRGLRWMDMKRLNKEGYNIIVNRTIDGKIYTLLPNSDKYALPLPADIVVLSGVDQNPGW
ncbi:MAG: RagB/SusD family nutrient uptake outer membrane protein [Chryseobacterium sp.]|nr:MAG: RagB/SusD family nutrient uptake outer membrane protein [Chryseobacterium sp.]